jgi:hypothetical protein
MITPLALQCSAGAKDDRHGWRAMLLYMLCMLYATLSGHAAERSRLAPVNEDATAVILCAPRIRAACKHGDNCRVKQCILTS